MPRLTRHPGALLPLAALLLLSGAPFAEAKVYKWVDENGVSHYTVDRQEIPPRYRRRLRPAQGGPVEITLEAPPPEARPQFGSEARAVEPPPPLTLREENEIVELETQIAAYREELKTLVSQSGQSSSEFVSNPRVREIADQLPRLQSQLQELQREAEH
jgi:hypothetical protein